jgi:hypothetical protein
MNRKLIICASLLLCAACDRSAKNEQSKAEQSQREADQIAARAEREAAEKTAKADKEANEKSAQANAEAQRDIAQGQAKANEKIREVNQDQVKAKNDFSAHVQKSASELDNKIDKMKVDAQTTNAKAKADFVAAMKDVDAKRAALDTDLRSINNQPIQQFDAYKAKVDKEIDELKKSIDVARDKL